MSVRINDESITFIVNEYADMVIRIAFQNTHNRCEAEDIMQDVFFALLKHTCFNDMNHVKAWLIRATINKSKDYLRSKRRSNIPLDEKLFSLSKADKIVIEELDSLPVKDKYLIYLFYFEDYSVKDIAFVLHKTEKSIYARLSRAREKLKCLIELGEGDE